MSEDVFHRYVARRIDWEPMCRPGARQAEIVRQIVERADERRCLAHEEELTRLRTELGQASLAATGWQEASGAQSDEIERLARESREDRAAIHEIGQLLGLRPLPHVRLDAAAVLAHARATLGNAAAPPARRSHIDELEHADCRWCEVTVSRWPGGAWWHDRAHTDDTGAHTPEPETGEAHERLRAAFDAGQAAAAAIPSDHLSEIDRAGAWESALEALADLASALEPPHDSVAAAIVRALTEEARRG